MSGALSRIVYIVVGLAGLYQLTSWRAIQRRWSTERARA
jgi:uncharacterized membrane protein YuzA (DUF378 family)